jgi:amidohydrolase
MSIDRTEVDRRVDGILPYIRNVRHHLHAHPELALRETETARYIRTELTRHDITPLAPFLRTDVVALVAGSGAGKNVTLRADTDALPIQENSERDYCSTSAGVMHACGHDGHTAMLLGTAIVLGGFRDRFSGSVRFVFQPGEEVVAAGRELVEIGALADPPPDAVLALHSWAGHPVGAIGSRAGAIMAAADFFRIVITGKGGHGSRPERTIDPILTATRVIDNLYALPHRRIGALEPVVISVCSIHGGNSSNVIPGQVVLEGTVRYLSGAIREKIPALIEEAVAAGCGLTGAAYSLEYNRPYIPTINNADIVTVGKKIVREQLNTAWVDLHEPTMGSEDFSYYLDRYPGAMFFLGVGEESPQLHNNRFDFNDEALKNGILFMVLATLALLGE